MAKGKADPPRPRALDAAERALWAQVTRDARPLKARKRVVKREPGGGAGAGSEKAPAAAVVPRAGVPRSRVPPTAPAVARLPELSLSAAPGLDRRTEERLRGGEMAIEARLDLHGHTQDEAHRALIAFVERAWRAERRTLLVITGKGRQGAGEGVLQSALPRWLNAEPLRAQVLAFSRARPKDGGAGALYILLRRQR